MPRTVINEEEVARMRERFWQRLTRATTLEEAQAIQREMDNFSGWIMQQARAERHHEGESILMPQTNRFARHLEVELGEIRDTPTMPDYAYAMEDAWLSVPSQAETPSASIQPFIDEATNLCTDSVTDEKLDTFLRMLLAHLNTRISRTDNNILLDLARQVLFTHVSRLGFPKTADFLRSSFRMVTSGQRETPQQEEYYEAPDMQDPYDLTEENV